MSRESRYDNNGAYRVVETVFGITRYWGPYATKGTAKGMLTRLLRKNLPFETLDNRTLRLEVIVGPWKELNE